MASKISTAKSAVCGNPVLLRSSTGENRWDEKAGLQRDALSSQVIDALEAREIEETGDEEAYHHDDGAYIQQAGRTPDRWRGSGRQGELYCVLDEAGDVLLEQKVSTTPKAIEEIFGAMPRSRIALETGTHSPWTPGCSANLAMR
jgi:hypothetical protein